MEKNSFMKFMKSITGNQKFENLFNYISRWNIKLNTTNVA